MAPRKRQKTAVKTGGVSSADVIWPSGAVLDESGQMAAGRRPKKKPAVKNDGESAVNFSGQTAAPFDRNEDVLVLAES
jgi:hypothetical protein